MTSGGQLRLAYLASHYPAISHSFIQREVEALRRGGVEIHTFAIRHRDDQVLTAADRTEASRTFRLRPRPWHDVAGRHARVLLGHPLRYVGTLVAALRLPAGGSKGKVSQLAYFAGAVVVWDECRRRGLAHIHAHFTSPAADVAQLVALLGSRGRDAFSWSFTAHGTDILDDPPRRLAEKLRGAALVVAVSDFGRARLMSLVGQEHWPKLRLIRCGLDRRWLAFEPGPQARPAGVPLRVLNVGRLEPEKGHALLLEAVAALDRRRVEITLELVGEGSQRGSLERLARSLGVESCVEFAGRVGQDRILERYQRADIFCLSSLGEGLPVVLMEAMATGVPVIAPAIMGIPELVEDGVSGLLVPPARPDRLAAAIETLAEDEELRSRLAAAGRSRVADRHQLGTSVELLRRAFEDLLVPTADRRPAADETVAEPELSSSPPEPVPR